MINKIIRHPFFSGSLLMIGGSLFVNGINYFYHLIMGRILGPVNYGVLASLFSILYIISIIPQSSGIAIAKFISASKDKKERSAFYWSVEKFIWRVALISSLILIVLSVYISRFLHIDDLLNVALIGPVLFLSLITLVNQASAQGVLKFIGMVGPNLISAAGKLLIGLILVQIGFSVRGAMIGVLVAVGFAYLWSKKIVASIVLKTKKRVSLKPFIFYSMPVLIQALAFTSFFTVDVILVRHYLPPFDVGLYAALSVLGKIIYFAAQPITSVMFPIVSGKKSRGEYYRDVFLVSFFATFIMSAVITGFYYLFPKVAIGVLYGQMYLRASGELVWMAIFITMYTLSYLLVNFLLSIGKTKVFILPLVATLGQIAGIVFLHDSILQVIQVSLSAVLVLFVGLCGYLVYFQFIKIYAKETRA